MGAGTNVLRGFLVFNGAFIDIFALFLLPIFAPAIAETFPWPNMKDVFSNVDGAPLVIESFAARMIAQNFFYHGIVRASAGLWPDRTLGWLVIASYFAEVVLMGYEIGVTGTITDPAALVLCPLLMYFCYACIVCADDAKGKTQ